MLLLEDVILYVAEDELEPLVDDFCCLTGATKLDTVTPCLTTHIICSKETPELRGMIGAIHAKIASGATSAKAALATERSHLDLVTPDWLKVCLLQQRSVKTGPYKPEVIKTTTETVLAAAGKSARSRIGLSYRVKLNVFREMTFAVLGHSFVDAGESADFVEGIKRRIIEYGGKIVDENDKANYVVQEDGYMPHIWKVDGMTDSLNRNIVHYRWVDECINQQMILVHDEILQLIPLPHKVPSLQLADIMKPQV